METERCSHLRHTRVDPLTDFPVRHPTAMPARRWSPGALLLLVLGLAALCGAQNAVADGVSLVKDYLRGLNSLQADFRQITLTGDGSQMLESRGTFYLLRPNRFRSIWFPWR